MTTVYKSLQTPNTKVGALFQSNSLQGLWSDRDIKATHISSRFEGSFSGDEKVQGPAPNQIMLHATDNSTVLAYINK